MRRLPALLLSILPLYAAPSLHADPWPQWRGPTGDGICLETDLPIEWSAQKNMAWSLPLPGPGAATPAVWDDRIFLTSAKDDQLWLLCVSTAGKPLWQQPLGGGNRSARGDEGGGASASPATDGKFVWAMVGNGTLACFTITGKPVWSVDLQKRYGRFQIQFGMTSTPVLEGRRLLLQLIHSGGAWVVCLDARTGREAWRHERKSDGTAECEHSYASPVVWRSGSKSYLITHGNDYAIAHSLKNGAEIWRVGGLNPKGNYNRTLRFVASPLATEKLIVVPTAKNGAVVAVKPEARGLLEAGHAGEAWRRDRGTPDVPSPLLHDGLLYLCRETGTLQVWDAKTGQDVYTERAHAGRHRASPVWAEGRVYLTARDGTVTVVQAGRQFKIVAQNKLDDEIAASPAIANGRIYLRGFEKLYAIDKSK